MRWQVAALSLTVIVALSACALDGVPGPSASPSIESSHEPAPPVTPTPRPPLVSIGGFPAQVPVDGGPREYAMGTVTLDDEGVPMAYLVASGDLVDFIAERFGFEGLGGGSPISYVNIINQVRRGKDAGFLYAGDVLNLSPYTITSIGSINGEVLDDEPPDPMPPQRGD